VSLKTFTVPPDTRMVGSGDPPVDMDDLIDTVNAMGATTNVLNAAYAGGADASGAADSSAAFQAAVDVLGGNPGVVRVPAGTYKIASTVTASNPGQYFVGDGRWATIINSYVTGDCLRAYTTSNYSGGGGGVAGGGIRGLTVDGTNAGAGSAGIHVGDLYNYEFDCGARHFQGTGSKNFWFDNNYAVNGMEMITGRIWAENGTTNVQFDVNAASGYTPSGSFDRANLKIFLDGKGKGNLVVLNNGAYIVDGDLGIYGNTDYGSAEYWVLTLTGPSGLSFTATNASPCVFTASGSAFFNGNAVTLSGASLPTGFTAGTTYYVVAASGTTFELSATSGGSAINSTSTGSGTVQAVQRSEIGNSVLNIGVECNGTSGTQPGTISFGTTGTIGNQINQCRGVIDFSGNNPFAGSNNAQSFIFDGPVYGDNKLQPAGPLGLYPYKAGALSSSGTIPTKFQAMTEVTTSGNVTGVILDGYPPDNWRLIYVINDGTGTITFAGSGTSNVANGTTCVIQPNTCQGFIWNNDLSLWFPTA